MSRVFVSCAYRDREVGAELGRMVRALGHESEDDRDDKSGTAWWNEVVGRIETSDLFIAVASPAYADAHACRLAAKHAAAKGLPVVRVDLDQRAAKECHPVVAAAVGMPFTPDDPEMARHLAQALGESSPEGPEDAAPEDAAPEVAAPEVAAPEEAAPEEAGPRSVPEPPDEPSSHGALDAGAAAVTLLGAVGLLYVGLNLVGQSDPPPDAPAGTAPAATQPFGTAVPTTAAAALLAQVASVGSPGLPASSCQAGADVVTCTNPAPNIRTVVLTPYGAADELYSAYAAAVEERSGVALEENTGNCSTSESEGELGWNQDKEHRFDFTVAQQEDGGLDPATESAGRVFCTDSQEVMSLVWTQDPGLLVTVTGQPSDLVVTWWSEVHLDLACAAQGVGSACAGGRPA